MHGAWRVSEHLSSLRDLKEYTHHKSIFRIKKQSLKYMKDFKAFAEDGVSVTNSK